MSRKSTAIPLFAALLIWLGLTTVAQAHGFSSELSAYRQIKIGAKLVLYQTEILLILVSCGLLMSFLDKALLRLGPAALFAGLLAGYPLAFVLQIDMAMVAIALVVVIGGAIAMDRLLIRNVILALLAGAGACLLPLGFLGHQLTDLPMLILGNFLFTSFLVVTATLAIGLLAKLYAQKVWPPIAIRVLGSWVSAIAILIGAFFIGMPG